MTYSLDIKNQKPIFTAYTTTDGVTPEIDLQGGTLDGVLFESGVTSTSFTIQVAQKSGGSFVTIKDGLGQFGVAGTNLKYTIPASTACYIPISPLISAGFRYCKIVLQASEAVALNVSKRNLQ